MCSVLFYKNKRMLFYKNKKADTSACYSNNHTDTFHEDNCSTSVDRSINAYFSLCQMKD